MMYDKVNTGGRTCCEIPSTTSVPLVGKKKIVQLGRDTVVSFVAQ